MTILDAQSMSDPVVVGVANAILIEVAKRIPNKYIPLDPNNKEQVKFVSGVLVFVLAVAKMASSGQINWGDMTGTIHQLIQLWLMGWVVSHAAYNAAPFVKVPPKESAPNV